ncbi:MAG: hypothetical protein ACW7DS_18610 [Paraglaciecola chathamensis]
MKHSLIKYRKVYAAISEDTRKAGVFCIGAGWVGILVGKDKMTGYTGLAILLSGLFLSAIGIYLEHKLSTAVTGEDL